MKREKRRLIYIAAWAVVILALETVGLLNFGFYDSGDLTLAIMFFVVPGLVMIADMAYFFRYDKYYSAFNFVAVNFLIVLGVTFVIESAVILIAFGILTPQVKLFIFAAVFSLMAAVLNLLQSCFLIPVMKEKRKKH